MLKDEKYVLVTTPNCPCELMVESTERLVRNSRVRLRDVVMTMPASSMGMDEKGYSRSLAVGKSGWSRRYVNGVAWMPRGG